MRLVFDGHPIEARPDQSLLDMVKELGLLPGTMAGDPIAAKIAGRVFTLNYIPVRLKDAVGDTFIFFLKKEFIFCLASFV